MRNVSPVKINEFAINSTDSFIELYNAGDNNVDLSDWTLTQHPTQQPIFSSVKVPAGTKLAAKGFYLLGLANSGLAVPAQTGDTTINVRSTTGMSAGDTVEIDTGSAVEIRKIASVGTAAGNSTTLWQPLPDGLVITIPAGSTNVPFTGAGGFAVEVGQKLGIGFGATYPAVAKDVEKYEVVTVTEVGKPGTQTYLAADAKEGDTNIMVRSAANISVGDQIRLDIASISHGIETVTVKSVGAAVGGGGRGGGGVSLELDAPLKFNHVANMPLSVRGTGISFQPATAFAHSSNEPLQPLGTGITLDSPLADGHAINAVVRDAAVTTAGYQETPAPNQWFGGPALSPNAGNMVLRDAAGLVVDSLNYGLLVDPWAAEGYQGTSPGVATSWLRPARAAVASLDGAVRPPARPIGARAATRTVPTPATTATIFCCRPPRPCRLIRLPVRTTSKSPAWPTLSPARQLLLIRARIARPPSSRPLARPAAPRRAQPPTLARPSSRSPTRQVSAPGRPSPLTAAQNLRRWLSPPSAAAAEVAEVVAEAALAVPQSQSPRRSRLRTRWMHRPLAPASPSPQH